MKKKRLILVIVLLLSLPAMAGTHWVSPTGAAAWGSCAGSTPLSGTSACSLGTANTNAVAGDVVNLRGGTYTVTSIDAFAPAHSGTAGSPPTMITFQAYTGETPTITGSGVGITLYNTSYISFKGITFSNLSGGYLNLYHSDHIEVASNTFQSTTGGPIGAFIGSDWNPPYTQFSTHNWIHDNHFVTTGQAHGDGGTGCTDGGGDTLNIGHAYSGSLNTVDNDNNNTVENNFFEHAPHTSLDQYGMYNVYRNNVFHNEPWSSGCTSTGTYPPTYSSSNPNYTAYNGMYAHRNFQVTEDYVRPATYLLVEGNRSGYAGVNQANGGADNFDLAAPQNIVRYNLFYGAMNHGMFLKYNWGNGGGGGGNGGTYNRIYNNTIYQNGYGYPFASTYPSPCSSSSCPWGQAAIGTDGAVGNILKNNLIYLNASYTIRGWDVDVDGAPSNGWSLITPSNNWCSGSQTGGDNGGCSASGDPKFTNPNLSSPSSTTLPDLSLQSSSTAIDGGTWLTTATNSGSGSTTLTVADALYFQAGTWGSSLAKASTGMGGTFQADWIAIGTVGNTAQVSAITYGTYSNPAGTITLSSAKTWSSGAHIWLYKKSDGAVVLNGSAPDYGASESSATPPPPLPPTGVEAVIN